MFLNTHTHINYPISIPLANIALITEQPDNNLARVFLVNNVITSDGDEVEFVYLNITVAEVQAKIAELTGSPATINQRMDKLELNFQRLFAAVAQLALKDAETGDTVKG